jgi:hypothetical protein
VDEDELNLAVLQPDRPFFLLISWTLPLLSSLLFSCGGTRGWIYSGRCLLLRFGNMDMVLDTNICCFGTFFRLLLSCAWSKQDEWSIQLLRVKIA